MAPALRMTRSIKEKLPVFFSTHYRVDLEVGVSGVLLRSSSGLSSRRGPVGFFLVDFFGAPAAPSVTPPLLL